MNGTIVLVPLLQGFEELEAVTIVDVLRRADVPVIIASDAPGLVQGSHGISVLATHALAAVDPATLAMIALPGGMPGARHLADHPVVQRLVQAVRDQDGYTAAICAGPIALASAGVHRDHTVTSYPGYADQLSGARYAEDRVVVDRRVVTSRGPGTALEFALTLVELLVGEQVAETLRHKMLVETQAPTRAGTP